MGDDVDKNTESRYERIWECVYPCIKKHLYDQFSNVNEMLCVHNWPVVHVTCKSIISVGMKRLNIDDPHEFDRAVCWGVVRREWDLFIKWRCICVFFLAAAMELVIVKREEEKFEKVRASGGSESTIGNARNNERNASGGKEWSIFDLFKKVDDLHKNTVDLHEKHDKLHDKLSNMLKNTGNNSATQVVHVNYSHPSQALVPVPQAAVPASAVDFEVFTRKLLEIMRARGGKGYDPHGEFFDEPPAQAIYVK